MHKEALNLKEQSQVVEVQGVKVLLTFSDKNNQEVSTLVQDILRKAYTRRKAA